MPSKYDIGDKLLHSRDGIIEVVSKVYEYFPYGGYLYLGKNMLWYGESYLRPT